MTVAKESMECTGCGAGLDLQTLVDGKPSYFQTAHGSYCNCEYCRTANRIDSNEMQREGQLEPEARRGEILISAVNVYENNDGQLSLKCNEGLFEQATQIANLPAGPRFDARVVVVMPISAMPGNPGVSMKMDVGQAHAGGAMAKAWTIFGENVALPRMENIAARLNGRGIKVEEIVDQSDQKPRWILTGDKGGHYRMDDPTLLISSDQTGKTHSYTDDAPLARETAKEFLNLSLNVWGVMRDEMETVEPDVTSDREAVDHTNNNGVIAAVLGTLGLLAMRSGAQILRHDYFSDEIGGLFGLGGILLIGAALHYMATAGNEKS